MSVWTFMLGPFQRRAAARLNITKEADALLARDGDQAYRTAREFSRELRQGGQHKLAQYWTYVALNIANKQGILVGEKVADRYEKYGREQPKGASIGEEEEYE